MTRSEQSGTRDLGVNNWIRQALPDSSTGLMVSDLDFILQNYKTKKVMMVEVKTHHAKIKSWQKNLFANINRWIASGIASDPDWQYLGFHLLQIDTIKKVKLDQIATGQCADIRNIADLLQHDKDHAYIIEGKIFFDNEEITKEQLIKKISF